MWNAINKYRSNLYFSNYSYMIITDFVLLVLFKDPIYSSTELPTGKMMYYAFIIGVWGFIFAEYQFKFGSRFFLPNWYRTKRYEYRRRIAEDFDLPKMDQSIWPEWDLCMQKLHQPSLNAENRNLRSIEGDKCYEMYMKARDGKNLHYFCLWKIIDQRYNQIGYFQKIDEFDD